MSLGLLLSSLTSSSQLFRPGIFSKQLRILFLRMNYLLVASRQSQQRRSREVSLKLLILDFPDMLLLTARKKRALYRIRDVWKANCLSQPQPSFFTLCVSTLTLLGWKLCEILANKRRRGWSKRTEGATTQTAHSTASLAEYSDNANFKLRLLDSSSSSRRLPHIR